MLLTLATLREELREAMLQATQIKDRENDICAHRAMVREEVSQILNTWIAESPKCHCGSPPNLPEKVSSSAEETKLVHNKDPQFQAWVADHGKSSESSVDSFRNEGCQIGLASQACHLKDIGVHKASRRLSVDHAKNFDPAFVPLPGEMDHDEDILALDQTASVPAVAPTRRTISSATMELEQISSIDDNWDANFPTVLRLPAGLRSSENGSTAERRRSERRRSVMNWRRNSTGVPSRRSLPAITKRRDSVSSHRSVESSHTLASTFSAVTPEVCRATSEFSTDELPIAALATRRPSFLMTRLDLDKACETLPPPSRLERLVYHAYFDITIAFLIILNGLSIGVQTDCMARAVTEKVPFVLRVIEIFFCTAFTMELALRIMVEGRFFFIGVEWGWNLFDCGIVLLQVFEEIMGIIAALNSAADGSRTNFSFMRMLRILRLIRIIRIVRVLRFIGELRTIVTSIASSMKHLLWTVMLLLLMIYTISVYFTQLVLDHRLGNANSDLVDLVTPWGSLGRSALTLFGSISGGIDWEIAVVPLIQHISVFLAPLFCLYIAFAILALMNVVTGVFVENAIDSANRDKERYLVQTVRELFEKADLDHSGVISWVEFESQLLNPELKTLLQALGIDQVSAKGLFKLLDIDNSGFIDANELLTGTLRLRGEARSIDLAALIYENRRNSRRVQQALSKVHEQLASMSSLCVRPSNRHN